MSNACKHIPHDICAGRGRRKVTGFTLLELMIVVGIVALLASIAMASYGFANVKARRGAAKGCLEQSAQYMERYYTTNFKYTGAKSPADVCGDEVKEYYTLGFDGTPDGTTYKLQAAPIAGKQKDGKCGTLTLDQTGDKTPKTEGCW